MTSTILITLIVVVATITVFLIYSQQLSTYCFKLGLKEGIHQMKNEFTKEYGDLVMMTRQSFHNLSGMSYEDYVMAQDLKDLEDKYDPKKPSHLTAVKTEKDPTD